MAILPKQNDSGRSGRYGLVGILHRSGPLLSFIAFMSLNAKLLLVGDRYFFFEKGGKLLYFWGGGGNGTA